MKYTTIRSLMIALGVMVSMALNAQSLETVDLIKTKAGSVWKGTITEITDDGYYLVQTLSGLELRLHESSILTVRQMWTNGLRPKKEYKFAESGIYHAIGFGMNASSFAPGLGLTYAIGYRFKPVIGVGIGTGLQGYDIGWGKNVIPVFAEARGYFLRKKTSPYYAVRGGYGFGLRNQLNGITEASGGVMFNPEVGVRFGGGSEVSYFMGVGVLLQKASFTQNWEWEQGTNTENYTFRRLELKFGIVF